MEPLSVFSLLFNLVTYNSSNDMNFKDDYYRYQSVYQVKQDIFNESFKNNNSQNFKKISKFNISLNTK